MLNPWVGKIPWRRKWQPTPIFLPGKSHGWRSLAGYSPWGPKESDMTERLHFLFFHFLQSLLNVLQYCFFFMFWFWACEILAPQPRIKPPALCTGRQSLNHWTAREVPTQKYFLNFIGLGLRCRPKTCLPHALGVHMCAGCLTHLGIPVFSCYLKRIFLNL